MKNLFFLLAFLFATQLAAQAPNLFNYQAVAKDASNKPIIGAIAETLTILNGSASGPQLYNEIHNVTADASGVFSLQVGGGAAQGGTLWSNIDWASNTKFLKVEIQPAGMPIQQMGTPQQLVSVPYAQYAKNSSAWTKSGNLVYNTTDNIGIQTSSPLAPLHIKSDGAGGMGGVQLILEENNANDGARIEFRKAGTDNYWHVWGFPDEDLSKAHLSFWRGKGPVGGINVMSLTGDGNVGIGTIAPQSRLEVVGDISLTGGGLQLRGDNGSSALVDFFPSGETDAKARLWIPNGNKYVQFDNNYRPDPNGGFVYNGSFHAFYSGGIEAKGATSDGFALKADFKVCAPSFVSCSDSRIKNIVGRSRASADLSTLLRLEVTDYTHKDFIARGKDSKKGFIAQEVEQVFPEAVSKGKDFTPDIYTDAAQTQYDPAARTLSITLDQPTDLKVGDRVRLDADRPYEVEVSTVSGNKFTVKDWSTEDTKKVFVFGKEVSDFRMVDYDRIFTLNVSATQELARQVDTLKKKRRLGAAAPTAGSQTQRFCQSLGGQSRPSIQQQVKTPP